MLWELLASASLEHKAMSMADHVYDRDCPPSVTKDDHALTRAAKWNKQAGASVWLTRTANMEFDEAGRLLYGRITILWPDTGERLRWTYVCKLVMTDQYQTLWTKEVLTPAKVEEKV